MCVMTGSFTSVGSMGRDEVEEVTASVGLL